MEISKVIDQCATKPYFRKKSIYVYMALDSFNFCVCCILYHSQWMNGTKCYPLHAWKNTPIGRTASIICIKLSEELKRFSCWYNLCKCILNLVILAGISNTDKNLIWHNLFRLPFWPTASGKRDCANAFFFRQSILLISYTNT